MKPTITEEDVRAGLAQHLPLALPGIVEEVLRSIRRAALERLQAECHKRVDALHEEQTKAIQAGNMGAFKRHWEQSKKEAKRSSALHEAIIETIRPKEPTR